MPPSWSPVSIGPPFLFMWIWTCQPARQQIASNTVVVLLGHSEAANQDKLHFKPSRNSSDISTVMPLPHA